MGEEEERGTWPSPVEDGGGGAGRELREAV